MKSLFKKFSIATLIVISIASNTMQAWPSFSLSNYLPSFTLSKPVFTTVNPKKVLIPLGALAATGLAAYTAYKLWTWKTTPTVTSEPTHTKDSTEAKTIPLNDSPTSQGLAAALKKNLSMAITRNKRIRHPKTEPATTEKNLLRGLSFASEIMLAENKPNQEQSEITSSNSQNCNESVTMRPEIDPLYADYPDDEEVQKRLDKQKLLDQKLNRTPSPKNTKWDIANNGHSDPEQITITHQAQTQESTATIVTFFIYHENDEKSKNCLNNEHTYESLRNFIQEYQAIAFPRLDTAQIKFYGLCIPEKLKNRPSELAQWLTLLSENAEKIITIACGENAEIVNAVSCQKNISIDTMIHLQPTFNTPNRPSNMRRVYNIYTKDNYQALRKYQQPEIKNFDTPIKNIRIITTENNGYNFADSISNWVQVLPEWTSIANTVKAALQQWTEDLPNTIVDYTSENFFTTAFIDQLPAILATIEQEYRLNFDLLVKIETTQTPPNYDIAKISGDSQEWQIVPETPTSGFKRPVVVINRFIEENTANLGIHDGSSSYTFATSINKISDIKKQFTKEYQTSRSELFDLITNIVEKPLSWTTLNEFLQRYTAVETTNTLYSRPDLKLNTTITNKLEILQNKLQISGLEAKSFNTDYAKKQIVTGANIARKINTTGYSCSERKEYLDTIISFCWFLYSQALEKNQLFTEGTFVIKDPNFKLFNFLYGYVDNFGSTAEKGEISYNPFAYNRVSSHFKPELKENPVNRHFGIDIRFTQRSSALTSLPTNKRHILFGKLNSTDLIFVKFENYGIYAFDGFPQHGIEFIESLARKLGLTQTSDDADDYRKERIPSAFIRDFNKIVDNHIPIDKRNTLKDLAKKKGIQTLYLKNICDNSEFDTLRQTYCAKNDYDKPEMRWGREVIILPEDIARLSAEICYLNQ